MVGLSEHFFPHSSSGGGTIAIIPYQPIIAGMSTSTMNLLSTAEAADYLGLSETRVRQLCARGAIGAKVGGRYIISQDELRQFAKIPRPVGNPNFGKSSGGG
jgi:excisionase family DNA binding protein